MKKIVHVYKGPGQWSQSPPGIGDFVRGTCHLFELLEGTGAELRIDISQTEFSKLIRQDPAAFQTSPTERIVAAEEWFVDSDRVRNRVAEFLRSSDEELYLSTNLGAWERPKLGAGAREFAKKFYAFTDEVERRTAEFITGEYVALSIRCGDKFYCKEGEHTDSDLNRQVFAVIEREVLPGRKGRPLVVMSDCYPLKCELVKRYGLITSPFASQHGAFGNVLPVAVDLNVLKNSRCNYHINAWQSWWSGFSHYTSLVFGIPSVNFRMPLFGREEVSGGVLRLPARVRARQQLRRLRSFVRTRLLGKSG